MPSLLAFGLFFAWEAWWWGNPVTIWGAVLSVFYLQTRHLYFIPIILGLYLITPVLSRYWSHLDTKNRYAAVTILTVLIMSVTIILFLTGALSELRTAPFAWLLYLPYFLGGALLRDLRVSGLKAELLFAVALGISFVSAILVYLSAAGVFRFGTFGNYPFDHQSLPVMAQTAIVFVLVQSYANRLPALVRQFVTFVSPATLGIYLLHPFIQDILGTTVSLFKLPLVAPVVIVLPLQFGILFGCSLAISWLCSKAVRTLTRHA
jgi:surface polysaccharide O-acyltransferase-like enzyme